jgi:hypothetical protein
VALRFSLEIPKMNAVKNDFKRRLARAEAAVSAIHPADLQAASHRQLFRLYTGICEFSRKTLLVMGLDPAQGRGLHIGEDAAVELAAIPDTEALQSADEAITHSDHHDCGEEENSVVVKLRRMMAHYSEGAQPDLAGASAVELYAFCLAQHEAGLR